ncbi:MAG TPA: hypothetical protein VFL10_08350 [Ornithinibacter sp.]|nr:hypothetical protein [Ornithinibacter sp.]
MTRTSATSFRSDAGAAPGCTIAATTDAVESPDGCLVTERVVVGAPRLLLGYMTGQAAVAHARTYRMLSSALA